MKNNIKGITLVTLTVTIIILSILSGITLSMVIDKNSILNISERKSEETDKRMIVEEIKIELLEKQKQNAGNELSTSQIENVLTDYGTIHYQNEDLYTLEPFEKDYNILIDELY